MSRRATKNNVPQASQHDKGRPLSANRTRRYKYRLPEHLTMDQMAECIEAVVDYMVDTYDDIRQEGRVAFTIDMLFPTLTGQMRGFSNGALLKYFNNSSLQPYLKVLLNYHTDAARRMKRHAEPITLDTFIETFDELVSSEWEREAWEARNRSRTKHAA